MITRREVRDGDYSSEMQLALDIADRVDRYTLMHFDQRDFSVNWKTNRTEVTEVDRNAEQQIVQRLRKKRPDHSVFGEEHGLVGDASAEWRWVIDPIDGTSGFVRGIPVWATLIALTHIEHGPVLGVVSAPALQMRWWGGLGLGAFTTRITTVPGDGVDHAFGKASQLFSEAPVASNAPIRQMMVSDVDLLAEAQVSITHNDGWDDLGLTDNLVRLQQQARRSRGMGDFWQHMLVAEGAMDVAVDAVGVAPYDLAAIQPIVEAAGGRFTDRHGESTHEHDTAISTNGRLHDKVLAFINA